ncbi:LysR family transcriptional regulator [Ascidiaceihabitans sp.]|nr:LysR family transcriptional regulator [Ascidiaceihabitans sp.]
MEYLTTAVRQGGISKAAAELNIAASAVGPRTADRTKPPSAN